MSVVPEVLAPAGGPDCLPAAVAGGADAVYLGLRHFNARGRAENFRTAELARHIAYLHRHGLKCYVVLNTLVHDDEHPKALHLAWHAREAGADAAIVQDLGLWSALARDLPGLERHASTQMTVHHPSQIAVLAGLGARRVILARELALDEIAACAAEAARLGLTIEHFVHGALCYSFSGQCLISNFAGCRSANRGTCAQNCRFDYVTAERGRDQTPFAMRDLRLVARVAELAAAGVASLKIEGRLKTPEYVFTVSRAYRAAVDAWRDSRPLAAEPVERLADVFARPFTDAALDHGYGASARHDRWAARDDRAPDAELVRADRTRGLVEVRAAQPVRAGQGFACTAAGFNDGFLVTAADALGGGRWRLKVRINPRGPRLDAGLPLWRNADHARKQEAAAAMAAVPLAAEPEPALALDLTVSGRVGEPLVVRAAGADDRRAEVASVEPCAAAQARPLDAEQATAALGALGGTPFRLGRLVCDAPGVFVPAARLKELRRLLVARLGEQPAAVAEPPVWPAPVLHEPARRTTALWVAVGSLAAAEAALAAGAAQAWLDDPCLDLWGPAAPRLPHLDGRLWLRHPACAPLSPHLAACALPVAAGHLGALAAARAAGLAATADHPLNAYGVATADALAGLGAGAVVLSLELSGGEAAKVAARYGARTAPVLALTVHGRLPAMVTRQDHGLAPGAVQRWQAAAHDGGLPYQVQRRRTDTVLWEARRLCAPDHAQRTATLVDAWLLELADLGPAAVAELVAAYAGLRDGAATPAQVAVTALRHAPDGLFPGHLELGSRALDEVAGSRTDAD
jgi:putative protease